MHSLVRVVEAIPKELRFYERNDGAVPVRDWLDALETSDPTTHDRIVNYLERAEAGNTSNFKPEGEGITALIMDFGPGWRIYFGQDGRELIVLLVGGEKHGQQQDIATAKEYWRNYNA